MFSTETINAIEKRHNLAGILLAYFLIYVVWDSTYYFIGVALSDFPPFLLDALRFSTAGTLLLGACVLRGKLVFCKKLIIRPACEVATHAYVNPFVIKAVIAVIHL